MSFLLLLLPLSYLLATWATFHRRQPPGSRSRRGVNLLNAEPPLKRYSCACNVEPVRNGHSRNGSAEPVCRMQSTNLDHDDAHSMLLHQPGYGVVDNLSSRLLLVCPAVGIYRQQPRDGAGHFLDGDKADPRRLRQIRIARSIQRLLNGDKS
jgi:hypothetical protein